MKYYRLMCSLPPLPLIPQTPPMSLRDVAEALHVDLSPNHWCLAHSLLLAEDVHQLEALISGVIESPTPDIAFSAFSLFADPVLVDWPEFAIDVRQQVQDATVSIDEAIGKLWCGYFAMLSELASQSRSAFLAEYVAFEVPLRNALARYRADRIGRDVTDHLLDESTGGYRPDDLVSQFVEQTDPVEKDKLVDTARLVAFDSFAGTDPFGIDAVLAYVASATVLQRWAFADVHRDSESTDVKQMLEVWL